MPICIPDSLPAHKILESENIFVMDEGRASHQDIRPLKIALLNLMPKKIETETQLLRLLGNTPIQVEVELVQTVSHVSKNTSPEHLLKFYKSFEEIRDQKFDGLVITGAPVEQIPFEEVDYWQELTTIMEWSKTNVTSTFHICWGAQAALYYHYGIPKRALPEKMFGVFPHRVLIPGHPLLRGFDDEFYAPHSRHTQVLQADIEKVAALEILAVSPQAGVYIAASRDGRQFFVTGHSEYDRTTLDSEYRRDVDKGLPIHPPCHYYRNDDPSQPIVQNWRGHANLLYSNWLNYFVYQITPYDLKDL